MKQIVIAGVVALGSVFNAHAAFAADPSNNPAGNATSIAETGNSSSRLRPMPLVAQPPNCLYETGTHIQPKDGCVAWANGRSYDREQLTANRELTLGGALSRDPALTIVGHR